MLNHCLRLLYGGHIAHINGKLHHTKPIMEQQLPKSRIPFALDFSVRRQVKNGHHPHNTPTIGFHLEIEPPATKKRKAFFPAAAAGWAETIFAGNLLNLSKSCSPQNQLRGTNGILFH